MPSFKRVPSKSRSLGFLWFHTKHLRRATAYVSVGKTVNTNSTRRGVLCTRRHTSRDSCTALGLATGVGTPLLRAVGEPILRRACVPGVVAPRDVLGRRSSAGPFEPNVTRCAKTCVHSEALKFAYVEHRREANLHPATLCVRHRYSPLSTSNTAVCSVSQPSAVRPISANPCAQLSFSTWIRVYMPERCTRLPPSASQ